MTDTRMEKKLYNEGDPELIKAAVQFIFKSVAYDENVSIGVHIFLNYDYVLLDDCPITIGSEVLIGPGCAVISKIENDFFIVAGVTILPCATGSDKVVVGVGSVVTQDIPPETIVAGILAKPIRKLEFD
ncbi:maltose O-acetyltransferase [Neocallimastix sp. 'constans']